MKIVTSFTLLIIGVILLASAFWFGRGSGYGNIKAISSFFIGIIGVILILVSIIVLIVQNTTKTTPIMLIFIGVLLSALLLLLSRGGGPGNEGLGLFLVPGFVLILVGIIKLIVSFVSKDQSNTPLQRS